MTEVEFSITVAFLVMSALALTAYSIFFSIILRKGYPKLNVYIPRIVLVTMLV